MEFQSNRTSARRAIKNSMKLKNEFAHSLQLYTMPPTETISLQEFEDLAVDRLKGKFKFTMLLVFTFYNLFFFIVLRAIERINLSKNAKFSDEWKTALKSDLRKQNLLSFCQLSSSIEDDDQLDLILEARRKDHISHFLLRLAYCRTEESRRWFIAQETDLFRFRFSEEKSTNVQVFMQENKLNFHPVSIIIFVFTYRKLFKCYIQLFFSF